MPNVEAGQFDDAPETTNPAIHRGLRDPVPYIDEHEDSPLEDADEEEYSDIDEPFDDNRVEDEDWENAERGIFVPIIH